MASNNPDANELIDGIKNFLRNPNLPDEATGIDIYGEYKERFVDLLEKQLNPVERTGEELLSPSQLGKCTRMLAYAYHGFEGEPLEPETKLTFIFGDLIELIIYFIADVAGFEITNKQQYINVDGIEGNIDGTYKKSVLDIKSASPGAFSIAERNGVSNTFGYTTQLQIYKKGTEKESAFWLYVNKATGEMAVFDAPENPLLVELAKRKKELVVSSSPGRLPARDHTLETDPKTKKLRLGVECKFCKFKSSCWNITGIGKGYNNSTTYFSDGPK